MYRLIDCQTWNDPWFEGLDPNGKLFFLYLIANPRSTSCGAFEITIRKMAFETGLTEEQVGGYLETMAPRVMWWPEHQVVWLRNFYRRQGNQNDKTRINARKLVAALPIAVQMEIAKAYPELVPNADTLSIPYPYPVHQKNNEKENEYEKENEHENEGESEGENAPAARSREAYPYEFEAFWRGYGPTDGPKRPAYAAWKKLTAAERDAAMAGLPAWHASRKWREGYKDYPQKYLNQRFWENVPDTGPARASPATNGRRESPAAVFARMAMEDG